MSIVQKILIGIWVASYIGMFACAALILIYGNRIFNKLENNK
jgi:putative Ca2+/H+ antiporter (TMEM165/GDT1 family)